MSKFQPYLAVYIIVRQQQRILLLQRKNTGFDDGKWSLPAGHVEEGESALTAAIREAEEEIGIVIPSSALNLVCIHCIANQMKELISICGLKPSAMTAFRLIKNPTSAQG